MQISIDKMKIFSAKMSFDILFRTRAEIVVDSQFSRFNQPVNQVAADEASATGDKIPAHRRNLLANSFLAIINPDLMELSLVGVPRRR